jgi:UDP-GlcNAc:undecaprenyl-phosphate GlcNAc-1-phosphate transferase
VTAAILLAAVAGALVAIAGANAAMARPPEVLVRTNVAGDRVPAVLGAWVVIGGLFALVFFFAGTELARWDVPSDLSTTAAAAFVLAVMGVAGRWDDRRGDEQPRGFSGHFAAAGRGRLTGGLVKVFAGAGAGGAAGLVLHPGDLGMIALTIAAVALSANLVNLLDRAPGRAGKVAILGGLLLAAFGDRAWTLAAAGTLGGLAAVLPADLRARGMLGDAGANPVGALLGLGLVTSLPEPALVGAVAVLLALNLASERWSFSKVIERTPALRALDEWGRK